MTKCINYLLGIRKLKIVVRRWSVIAILLSLVGMLSGCVAQQADVVRIKRELDAKIRQLDKSKTSLQQAITNANTALEKANALIAGQRTEIQDLLQARAEVMDQVATLKETDLSQVRGEIEQNQHIVSELDQKFVLLDGKVQTVDAKVQESHRVMEPLVQKIQMQLTAEEQLRVEQGGKLGEFQTSLVDYQQVLTTLHQNVAKQEQQVVALRNQIEKSGQEHGAQYQQIQADMRDVRLHVKNVIATLEQVSTTFSGRLDAYEQQRSRVPQQTRADHSSLSPVTSSFPLSNQNPNSTQAFSSTKTQSSIEGTSRITTQSKSHPQVMPPGSAVAYASSSPQPSATSSPSPSASSLQKATQNDRLAYQQAINLLRAKNFREATKHFSGFLRTYPNSPLAANSQYWLGECYYGQRRFQEAIDDFERVFTFYPSSNKVPAALLKIGYSHLELQQPSMARSVFQQLVRTYPQSPSAIKAHGRLQEVNALLHNPS